MQNGNGGSSKLAVFGWAAWLISLGVLAWLAIEANAVDCSVKTATAALVETGSHR